MEFLLRPVFSEWRSLSRKDRGTCCPSSGIRTIGPVRSRNDGSLSHKKSSPYSLLREAGEVNDPIVPLD